MKFILILTFLFTGCASLEKAPFKKVSSFNKKKALVYIYRNSKFAGSAGSPYVCFDKKVVGESINGGYFPVEVKPGSHSASLRALGETLTNINFKVKAGKTYFLRHDTGMFNGAKEATQRAHMHTGPTGGGAIGGAVSGAAGAMFFSSSDEIKQTVKNMDKRAMKKAVNPGFLFVKASFAQEEIKKTNLFKVPQYKDNPCAPAKKKKKPPTNSI